MNDHRNDARRKCSHQEYHGKSRDQIGYKITVDRIASPKHSSNCKLFESRDALHEEANQRHNKSRAENPSVWGIGPVSEPEQAFHKPETRQHKYHLAVIFSGKTQQFQFDRVDLTWRTRYDLSSANCSANWGVSLARLNDSWTKTIAAPTIKASSVATSTRAARGGQDFFSGGSARSNTWTKPAPSASSIRAISYCLASNSKRVSRYFTSRRRRR